MSNYAYLHSTTSNTLPADIRINIHVLRNAEIMPCDYINLLLIRPHLYSIWSSLLSVMLTPPCPSVVSSEISDLASSVVL